MTVPEHYDSESFNADLVKGGDASVRPDGDSLYWLIDIGKLPEDTPDSDVGESLE